MKLLIGITTYNRKDVIEYNSLSLSEIKNINYKDVIVIDDNSLEFDNKYLKNKYKQAIIKKNNMNVGADKNLLNLLKYFNSSNYDYLFIADSDLIFDKDILKTIEKHIKCFDKDEPILFSLFNTLNHKIIDENKNFYIKDSIGAAGAIINKKLVNMYLNNENKENYPIDYDICKYYKSLGYFIYTTKNSYVNHIGIDGFNSNAFRFDFGYNFNVNSLTNAKAIIYVYEKYINISNTYKEKSILEFARNGNIGISISIKILIITIKNRIKRMIR